MRFESLFSNDFLEDSYFELNFRFNFGPTNVYIFLWRAVTSLLAYRKKLG